MSLTDAVLLATADSRTSFISYLSTKQVVSGIHNFYFLYTKITWPLGWKMDLKRTKTLFPPPLPFRVSQNLKLSGVELCFLCANNSRSVSAFDFLHLLCCLLVCCCVSETCSTCVADVWRKRCLRLKTQDRKGDPNRAETGRLFREKSDFSDDKSSQVW